MEINLNNTLLASDPRLIDHIVGEVKSQGIFDQFRKECIADVDTKPAYQNLRTRVEGSVNSFLDKQTWKAELNKNQLRETLRKHIHEAPYLDVGVERIVDQVVNPKVYSVFMPQIEDVVYKFLGLEKPKAREKNGACSLKDLLPKDLDPVSPESDRNSLKDDSWESDNMEPINGDCEKSTPPKNWENNEKPDTSEKKSKEIRGESEKMQIKSEEVKNITNNGNCNDLIKSEEKATAEEEEEDSPSFEPIDIMNLNESNVSNDSHLSGISELTSHRSRSPDYDYSRDNFDVSNQDSQLSKVSSDSRLSIITDFGSSNPASTPIPDSKEEKTGKENLKCVRNFDFESIKAKDNNSQDGKEIKSGRNSVCSKENSRDAIDGPKDFKEKNSKEDSIRSKSSKEKSSSRDSKSHRDKDSKRKHSSSSSVKSDKSKSKTSSKDKTEDTKESMEKSKDTASNKSKDKSEKNEKKDGPKDVKDLKDIYKEKIRELREKKELTEKEKLGKTSKEGKEKKDASKDRKEHKKEHKSSSSSRSFSTSKHDDKSNKTCKDKSCRDKNKKLDTSTDSKKSSRTKKDKDEKKSRKDSKSLERNDKSDDKNKEKNSKDKKRRDEKKKSKDDHSSLRKSSSDRRSTDRDGSNGSSGKSSQKNSSGSNTTSGKSNSTNLTKDSNNTSHSSSETSNGVEYAQMIPLKSSPINLQANEETMIDKKSIQSDSTIELTLPLKKRPLQENSSSQDAPRMKKPKFAKNFAEAKRLMKVRKQMEKEILDAQEADKKVEVKDVKDEKNVEEDVASLPDEERVQIIEVPDEEDDQQPYSDNQSLWTLEKTSKIILSDNEPSRQTSDPLQTQSVGQSKLSQMDSSIRNSLDEMISDEKLLRRNDGTKSLEKELLETKENVQKETVIEKMEDVTKIVENNDEYEHDKKDKIEEKEENIEEEKNETKIEVEELLEKTESENNEKSDHLEVSTPSSTVKEKETNDIANASSPEQDCLYLKLDNDKAHKFSHYMEKMESAESSSNLEQIIEILGGQMVSNQSSRSMAPPPQTSLKRSASSPLSDILMNNTNNNNEGVKTQSPELTQESAKKRKRGRPKKQKPDDAAANVCDSNFNNGENFVMPLSPESDVSATSEKATTVKEEKSRQRSKQHYTSDDLYKPRPLFSSSSRRNRRSNPA